MKYVALIAVALAAAALPARAQDWNPFPLLDPPKMGAYGPGIHSDATGRPFQYRTETGETLHIEPVKPDAYGPGIGMDIYGRPVRPVPLD